MANFSFFNVVPNVQSTALMEEVSDVFSYFGSDALVWIEHASVMEDVIRGLFKKAQKIASESTLLISNSCIGTTSWAMPNTIQFKPEDDSVGYWELGKGFHFYNKKKPNWLHQKMVAMLMGLKWKDK